LRLAGRQGVDATAHFSLRSCPLGFEPSPGFLHKKTPPDAEFFMELVDGLDRIALCPSILLCCFARIAMLPGDPRALAKKCCAFFFTLVPSRVRAVSWSSP
jgi:hypothetical protein